MRALLWIVVELQVCGVHAVSVVVHVQAIELLRWVLLSRCRGLMEVTADVELGDVSF